MRKISKILFSMCGFFITVFGGARGGKYTGILAWVPVENTRWTITPGGCSKCARDELVYLGALKTRTGEYAGLFECAAGCKTDASFKVSSFSLTSLFSGNLINLNGCDTGTYCAPIEGAYTTGNYRNAKYIPYVRSGSSSSGSMTSSSVSSNVYTYAKCSSVADCYGVLSSTFGLLAEEEFGTGTMRRGVTCDQMYINYSELARVCGVTFEFSTVCGDYAYRDPDIACGSSVSCCIDCPDYEYGDVFISATGGTGKESCFIGSDTKTVVAEDATGAFEITSHCFYSEQLGDN